MAIECILLYIILGVSCSSEAAQELSYTTTAASVGLRVSCSAVIPDDYREKEAC